MDPGEAILRVLRRAHRPLTSREITHRMTEEELVSLWGDYGNRYGYAKGPPPIPFPMDGPLWRTVPYHWKGAPLRVASRLRFLAREQYVQHRVIIEDGPDGAVKVFRVYWV